MKSILIAAIATLCAATSIATAETCADRTVISNKLIDKFGETLVANAEQSSNNVLEVYAAPDARTWTLMVYVADKNLSCLAASGKGRAELQLALSRL